MASERGVEILAFTRDRGDVQDDDDRYATAIDEARAEHPYMSIVGGLARSMIEGWVLAANGHPNTEAMSKPAALAAIAAAGLEAKSREAYVEVVEHSEMQLADGHSLKVWLDEARQAFAKVLSPEI